MSWWSDTFGADPRNVAQRQQTKRARIEAKKEVRVAKNDPAVVAAKQNTIVTLGGMLIDLATASGAAYAQSQGINVDEALAYLQAGKTPPGVSVPTPSVSRGARPATGGLRGGGSGWSTGEKLAAGALGVGVLAIAAKGLR